jgi:hypothetical protein
MCGLFAVIVKSLLIYIYFMVKLGQIPRNQCILYQ